LVYADRVALSQVIMNLTDNAIDALMELSGEREIRFSGGMRGSSTWLSVVDNGPGIPPEIVENIYDPFFTTKPVGKGTGLGLYIVRNEITKCGGSVDIRRRPEGGTEFVLTLPGEVTKVAA
jgi:C4-dicarboxylate-specific signal transduction histidine kinase